MDFEVFERKYSRGSGKARVGLTRGGYFSLNAAAFELLGEPARVLLLFNSENSMVAFEPIEDANAPNSYKVSQQGESRSYVIAGKAFCDHYGISYDEVRHFTPYKEEKLLVFEIPGAGKNSEKGGQP